MEQDLTGGELKPRVATEVSIVMSCSETYAKYAAVTIRSIIEHASSQHYTIYLLHENLSVTTQELLQQMQTQQVQVRYVDMYCYIHKYSHDFFYTVDHFASSTYYRLFVPIIFRHFQRIIYCDCDAVFVEDPAKLYKITLTEEYVAAVHDTEAVSQVCSGNSYFEKYLSLSNPRQDYFQAGLLVFNIPVLLKNGFTEKCLQVLEHKRNLRYLDQDILNIVCEGKVKFLEPGWNLENYVLEWRPNLAKLIPTWLYKETISAVHTQKFVHYAGDLKPWMSPNSYNALIWWKYARQTPYYEVFIYEMHLNKYSVLVRREYIKGLVSYRADYINYKRCKTLSRVTWGKTKEHYLKKSNKLHKQIRKIREWLK